MRLVTAVEKLEVENEEVPDNVTALVPVHSKLHKWVAENAFTLAFLSIMFFITWVILVVGIVENLVD